MQGIEREGGRREREKIKALASLGTHE